jgi:CDP-glucose 4,6-dehydratase|tara:strand:- start:17518 stop:18591 length:1074 start_codon:yes stop_codon:yes gene_type:complete
MINNLEFFKNKRIFITGHTGFKGSWLSKIMLDSGAEVGGFSLPLESEESHFNLLNIKDRINHYSGDITDDLAIKKAILEFKPEIIFHMAAQALVRSSYNNPKSTFNTNVMGSLNVLESIKECSSVKSVIYVTSDKCYENVEWVYGYKETDTLGGHDPYSASKACAEILFSSYKRSFLNERENFGIASVRAGNVIGGGDFSIDRIVPDCIRAIRSDTPLELRNPLSTRPWQHVLEPLSGYILLAQKLYDEPAIFSESWNFGPNSSEVMNVGEVAETIIQVYGKGKVDLSKTDSIFHEANLLQLNCDLANRKLNWWPRWDVKKTLEMTASWYKELDDGRSVSEITQEHIKDYFGGNYYD